MKNFFGPKRQLPDILWNQNEPLLVPSLSKSACDLNLTYPTFFFYCETNFYQVSPSRIVFFSRLLLHLKPRNSGEFKEGQRPKHPSKNVNAYCTFHVTTINLRARLQYLNTTVVRQANVISDSQLWHQYIGRPSV